MNKLRALVPSANMALGITGFILADQVMGRVTIGKPFTRALADGTVRMLGGNRRLLGS